MKVVIADDSELIRQRLKDSLVVIKGVEIVGEAENGTEALQMIIDYKPDFVILDIRMPGMSGISVLKKMKEMGCKSKTCIFSNYPYQPYKQKCLQEGADYFFDKSQDFNEVINLITELSENEYRKKITNIVEP